MAFLVCSSVHLIPLIDRTPVLGEPKKRILPREEVRLIVSLALIAVKFIAISLARTKGETIVEGGANFIGGNTYLSAGCKLYLKLCRHGTFVACIKVCYS